jgi:hypothetical protein
MSVLSLLAKQSRKSLTEAPRSPASVIQSAITKVIKDNIPDYVAYLSKETGWKFSITDPVKTKMGSISANLFARNPDDDRPSMDGLLQISASDDGSIFAHGEVSTKGQSLKLIVNKTPSLEDFKSPAKLFYGAELSKLKGDVSDAALVALQTQVTVVLQSLEALHTSAAQLSASLDSASTPGELKKLSGVFAAMRDNSSDYNTDFLKLAKSWKDYNLG